MLNLQPSNRRRFAVNSIAALGMALGMLLAGRKASRLEAQNRHPARAFQPAFPGLIQPRRLPLPGRPTRFDYESYDPRTHRLYIAHLGDSQVLVFDTRRQKLVQIIPGISRVHGVLAVPSLGRVYASATGKNQVAVISEKTLRVIARAPAGVYPDGLAYESHTHEIYISDEAGGTDTVLNTRTNRRVATIALGGEAGNTQYDPVRNLIYVDVQTANRLKAIDPATRKITASYPLPGCRHDHGLHLIAPLRLAMIACDGNARLLAFSLRSHRVLARFSVGKAPDVLAYDAGLRRLYVAAESGVVAAFALGGSPAAPRVGKLWQGFVAPEAHSIAVDERHRVYLPIQNLRGRPALWIFHTHP